MQENETRARCLFCRIADGAVPANVVRSDDNTVAFRDINPQAPIHVLVIPRLHVSNAAAAAEHNLWQVLITTATAIAQAEGLDEGGYRLVINSGPDAGQSVDHLHIHLLGGRRMAWPPG